MSCGCGQSAPPSVTSATPSVTNVPCCPIVCATAFTTGDTQETVPEFDTAVSDLQLVEITVTGYVVRTDANNNGTQNSFIYMRALARRFDADDVFPGLTVLAEDFTLQLVSTGIGINLITSGNTLQVRIDGAAGDYRWDLEMSVCVKNQTVNVSGGA